MKGEIDGKSSAADDASLSAGAALRLLLDERPREMEAALAIVRRVTSGLDVDVVLSESLALATAVARCQVGAIYLLDDADQRLWIRAASPGYEWLTGKYSLEVGAGLTGWTALHRTPAMVGDNLHEDPRYAPVPEVDLDFRSALTYPMISPSDALVGVITLHTKAPREFRDKDLIAVGPIAALAAAAVETAQLFTRSQRQVDVLRSIGTVGDALASPAATRRALRSLADAARLLVGGSAVALYASNASGWRLITSVTDGPYPPHDELSKEVVDSVSRGESARLTLRDHRELFEAVVPGDQRVTTGIVARLSAGAETVGVLVCAGERLVVSATEQELFKVIATVSATVIQSGRLVERLAARDSRRALLDGLTHETEPPGILAARARELGVDLDEPHLAASFSVVGDGGGAVEPERALELLGAYLADGFPGSVAALHDLELLALLRVDDADLTRDSVSAALARAEAEAGHTLIGGLSGPTKRLERYAQTFREAREAMQIGHMTVGGGHVTQYDELGAQRHLWTLARSSARDPFQERLVVLREHDATQGSSYLETLEAYLQAYGNRERASSVLHIHRNTLRQRIERIKELSGIDLEDESTIFEVQTALGIMRFREFQRSHAAGR